MNFKGHFHTHLIIKIVVLSLLFSPFIRTTTRAFALSCEEETILGEEFLAQKRRDLDFVDDDFANQFINDLGHYLIKPLETKHFPFRFFIIQDNTLNAFAGPGGHIFVTSGLIQVMDSIDELAAVMCHEIGHVSARHLAHRIEYSNKIALAMMAGILVGVLIKGPAGGAVAAGSMAAMIQSGLHISRNDEQQADQLGFKYMKASGFDPSGMITILEKIEMGQLRGANDIPTYLKTHPGGAKRMSDVDILLSIYTQESSKKETEKLRVLFPFFKTLLRAKCLDHCEAERLFNMELKKNPRCTLTHFGLGVVYKEKSQCELGIHHLHKALEGEPDSIAILRVLGQAYQMNGQDREAISVFKRALSIDEADRSTLFLLGMSYERLEQYEKAIHIYKKLTAFKPIKSAVYYHLGLSYGRHNQLSLAHYNFGLYFKQRGQIKKSRFHFQKAEDFLDNNPALKKKIVGQQKGLASYHM